MEEAWRPALKNKIADLINHITFEKAQVSRSGEKMRVFLNADRLFEKLGAGKLMSICALALTIRWILLASFPNIYVAAGSQILHGWGFIVMTVSMSKYMSAAVPDELKASGQMMLALVGFGIARVFGILGGGLLSEAMGGVQNGFAVMACISGAALTYQR